MFRYILVINIILISAHVSFAQDSLMEILNEELNRELEEFKSIDYSPYYIEYRVSDFKTYDISTSFGSLIASNQYTNRVLTADLRIGDYEKDNTHNVYGFSGNYYNYSNSSVPLPLENDPFAIKQLIWLTVDQIYKNRLEIYKQVINSERIREREEKCDFTKEKVVEHYEKPSSDANVDVQKWEEILKNVSSAFKENKHIIDGDVSLQANFERRYFISSEGTKIVQNFPVVNVSITGSILSNDNNVLPLYISHDAVSMDKLPSEEQLIAEARELVKKLDELKDASLADPYSGPAIFSPRVAGVFFHEIFGHRVEGHRLKNENDGQTFKDKLDHLVLPKFITVVSDPTLRSFHNYDLTGFYEYDDQGVKSQKVTLVEDGILKNFLMSRTPLLTKDKSNGHGRASVGYAPVSRQSNLIVKSDRVESDEALRKMLIKECKKQKKDYGYYFKDVTGGFTTTDRYSPNAFNIMPTEVYRIYADGRPDELVRGVDMIGTPLTMFSEIEATGDHMEIFSGHCGAESGYVPVTAIAPSLFVKKIETQRKMETHIKLPLLVSPEYEYIQSNK